MSPKLLGDSVSVDEPSESVVLGSHRRVAKAMAEDSESEKRWKVNNGSKDQHLRVSLS